MQIQPLRPPQSCLALLMLFVLLLSGCIPRTASSNTGENGDLPASQGNTNSNAGPGNSEQATGEQNAEVLWDFRTDVEKDQKFSKAETQAVLKYLFGTKWDADLYISSRFSGSFTKPNSNETLYYVGGCDEDDGQGFKSTANCAHASWWNAGRIAIFDGSAPVLKIEAALGYQIAKTIDVDGDGIGEIFALAGYSNMGESETTPSLGHIVDGKYKEIRTFSGAGDTCASDPGMMPRTAKATVIRFKPTSDGKMPDFVEEYFQNKCDKTPWKKITKKQFDGD